MTVSEYAKSRGISREAVCKQLRAKSSTVLFGHISKGTHRQGWLLDEFAISYLDNHRVKKPISY